MQIVDDADPVEQAQFVAAMQAESKRSSVSEVDDNPVEFHDWATEFPIYGTKYKVRGGTVVSGVDIHVDCRDLFCRCIVRIDGLSMG